MCHLTRKSGSAPNYAAGRVRALDMNEIKQRGRATRAARQPSTGKVAE